MTDRIPFEQRQVPSEGLDLRAPPLAFIGEAPSDEEVIAYRPFVGPSGRILDALLRSAGIDRKAVYIGNIYDQKLIDNSVVRHRQHIGDSAWEAFHIRNISRLAGELEKVAPRVVVPLGGTALGVLFGSTKIMQFRGQPAMGFGNFSAYKLFPTVHPAFILQSWKWYVPALGDIIRAEAESRRPPGIHYPERALYLHPTLGDVERYLGPDGPAVGTNLLSVDIETGWGMIRGIAFAPSSKEAMYVPFIDRGQISRNYWTTAEQEFRAWKAVGRILEHPVPKLGQNFGSYDAVWLLDRMGIRVMNYTEDTRLLHKALYPELPASLQFMGAAYSTQGAWKAWADHGGTRKEVDEKRDA